nr:uncharacterized protein LOC122273433 [Parasteatoda tepidariorum]
MAVLLKCLHHDNRTESYYQTMLDGFDNLYRQSHKWVWRQTYISLCQEIVVEESMDIADFIDKVAPKLFSLGYDKVPNVRLSLARCITSTLLTNGIYSFFTILIAMVKLLYYTRLRRKIQGIMSFSLQTGKMQGIYFCFLKNGCHSAQSKGYLTGCVAFFKGAYFQFFKSL